MKTWAEVNLRLEDKEIGGNVHQSMRGDISGTDKGIMELIAYMIIDRADRLKISEGEVMAKLFVEVAKTKTHLALGYVQGSTTDISELKKALEELKKEGGKDD